MKLTKSQLKKIIKEEIGRLSEQESGISILMDPGEGYQYEMLVRGASTAEIVKDDHDYPNLLVIDGKTRIQFPGIMLFDTDDEEAQQKTVPAWMRRKPRK